MKKITSIVALGLLSMSLFAQKRSNSNDLPEKLNAVKINVSSLLFSNVALQYERVLGPKISVAGQIRFMPNRSFISTGTNTDNATFDNLKLSSWAFTPEFRFYPKHAMKGFYLAPYLRLRGINMDLPLSYIDDNSQNQSLLTEGKFNSFGGGLMIGSHFNIGNAISLDWFIIGLQYMSTNAKFSSNSSVALSVNDQADLRKELETLKTDASNFVKNIDYNVTSNNVSISGRLGALGIRGFGLNLGYRF